MLLTWFSIFAILIEIWDLYLAMIFFGHRKSHADLHSFRANLTVIKPLKGISPYLRENLVSFLEAEAPGAVQIIFAVESEQDPVLRFLEKLIATTPTHHELMIVKGIPAAGKNAKNSSLLATLPFAKHPWIYISDADVSIQPNHLKTLLAATNLYPGHYASSVPLGRRLEGFFSRLLGVGMNFDKAEHFASCASRKKRYLYGGSNFFHRELEKEGQALQKCVNSITDDLVMLKAFRRAGGVGHLLADPARVSVGRIGWFELEKTLVRWLVIQRVYEAKFFWWAPVEWFWQIFLLLSVLTLKLSRLKFAAFLLLLRMTRFFIQQMLMGEALSKSVKLVAHLPIYDLVLPYFWVRAALARRVYFGGRWLDFDSRGEILDLPIPVQEALRP